MLSKVSHAVQMAHLNEGTCGCHDSWDQCPCAEGGHFPGCNCCPIGTGLCGPKDAATLVAEELAAEWESGLTPSMPSTPTPSEPPQ